jgi:hypothetical protein
VFIDSLAAVLDDSFQLAGFFGREGLWEFSFTEVDFGIRD